MSLFVSMLPFYLLGNIHCFGMCGPLVMMIGRHPYRMLYFLGRLFSFSLAGLVAGGMGSVLNVFLNKAHIASSISIVFGLFILGIGVFSWFNWPYPGAHWASQKLARTSQKLSLLILQENPLPTFLFGFFTVLLPCGQTLIVFSACALSADALVGFLNGLAFALLTTPSLFFALNAYRLVPSLKKNYSKWMGAAAILIGSLAVLRGLADAGAIDHFALTSQNFDWFHLIVY